MKTYNLDPNFSIVMTGGCNACCNFCFNNEKAKTKRAKNFAAALHETMWKLPDNLFRKVSITGGEPLLSPDFEKVMKLMFSLRRFHHRVDSVVLTTNGTDLLNPDKIPLIIGGVDHLNISRHHYDEKENLKIFGGRYNITDDNLSEIVDVYSRSGVTVSLNCVITNTTDKDFILNFIDFAKRVGAYSVAFRKQTDDSLKHPAVVGEFEAMGYHVLEENNCPVCSTKKRVIRGLTTYWKTSIKEPIEVIKDRVFELVFDTDGKVYADWNKQHLVNDVSSLYYESDFDEPNIDDEDDYGRSCSTGRC